MEETKSFWLDNSRKHSWFDYHRNFLPSDHKFKRSKLGFRVDVQKHSGSQAMVNGDHVWEFVRDFSKVTEHEPSKKPGFGSLHNWTKGVFFEIYRTRKITC